MDKKKPIVWGHKKNPSSVSSSLREISNVMGDHILGPAWRLSSYVPSLIGDTVERFLVPRKYCQILEACYHDQLDVAEYARHSVSTGCAGDVFFLRRYEKDEKMYSRLLKIRETFFEHLN
jgi:hypothetical protein